MKIHVGTTWAIIALPCFLSVRLVNFYSGLAKKPSRLLKAWETFCSFNLFYGIFRSRDLDPLTRGNFFRHVLGCRSSMHCQWEGLEIVSLDLRRGSVDAGCWMAGERRPLLLCISFVFFCIFIHPFFDWMIFLREGKRMEKHHDDVCDLRTPTHVRNNATRFLWVCEVKTWQNHTKSYAEEVWLPTLEKQCLPPSRTLEFLPAEHLPISTGKGFSRCLGPNNCFAVDFKWILLSLLAFHTLLHHVFMKFVRFSVMIFVCKLSTETYWCSDMFFLHFPGVFQPTRWFRWGFTGPCCTLHSTMVGQGRRTRRYHSQHVKTLASNGLYAIHILNPMGKIICTSRAGQAGGGSFQEKKL